LPTSWRARIRRTRDSPRDQPRYGGALRSGFLGARKEWIFYTDGDAQYDPAELAALWPHMAGADLVNGYKISRSDPLHRKILGRTYHHLVSILFGLRVKTSTAISA